MSNKILAKLVRALYWVVSGFRALHNDIDEQVMESMAHLWDIAREIEKVPDA